MNGFTVEEAAESLTAGMTGHYHDLLPVISAGELVASICATCRAQCSAEAWVRQGDDLIDAWEDDFWSAQAERRLRLRAEADIAGVPDWQVIYAECWKCGT